MQSLELSEWETSLQPVIDDMGGRPLNVHALLANHPALLEAWWPLRMYLVNGGDLDRRHCELVILRVAAHTQSWYEWASHVVRGLDSGLSLEEIEKVQVDNAAWDEPDAILVAAVDELEQKNHLGPDMLNRLAPHFTERQLLDVIHLHGMYTTIARVINTWSVELDEHVTRRLPDSVTKKKGETSFRP